MTVNEIAPLIKSKLRLLSGYSGKVLCYDFKPDKHKVLGERGILSVWSEIEVTHSPFGNSAQTYLCAYVNGRQEMLKEHPEWEDR